MPRTFGDQLRHWRDERGLSQVELGALAGVSQRHVSFLETGRSRPSQRMVLQLGSALDVPLREQNAMLEGAGFPPVFAETPLDRLPRVRRALEAMLDAHAPTMALIVDGHWDIVVANDAVGRFMDLLFPDPRTPSGGRGNLMRLTFAPDGIRGHMASWERTAAPMARRLLRDAAERPDDGLLHDLVDEVLAHPGVRDLAERHRTDHDDPVVTARYLVGGAEIALFTMITTIGDAHDVTLAELRLLSFWPADEFSARAWSDLVDSGAA